MMLAKPIVFRHAEQFKDLDQKFAETIERILQDRMIDEDGDTIIEMLEIVIPGNMVIFPNEADIHIEEDRSITISATALDVVGMA